MFFKKRREREREERELLLQAHGAVDGGRKDVLGEIEVDHVK